MKNPTPATKSSSRRHKSSSSETRARITAVVLGVAATLGLASTSEVEAQQLEQLRMTIPVPALVFYPVFAAQTKGFFEREGIEMEVINTQGDGPDVDALIGGSVQFTTSTPNRLLTAYEQGLQLKAVMSVSGKMQIHCFINSESAAAAGITPDMPLEAKLPLLDGMTLAGTRPGSFSYLVAMDYITRGGLVPQDDVTVIGVGGGQAMIAAIENGQADLGCFASPVVEIAVSRGKSEWFVNNALAEDALFPELLFELVYVRPDYAAENPETVRRVLRALVAANEWIMQATPEEHLEVTKPLFPELEDAVLLEAIETVKAGITVDGCISDAQVANAVSFLRRVEVLNTDIPASAVVDNSFLPSACN